MTCTLCNRPWTRRINMEGTISDERCDTVITLGPQLFPFCDEHADAIDRLVDPMDLGRGGSIQLVKAFRS